MRGENPYKTQVDLNVEDMTVDVRIVNKEDDTVAAEEIYAAADIHDSIKQQVALYGLSKLLQDRASDVPIGPEKIEAMKAVLTQLAAGQWAKERKIGAVVTSPEVEALAQLKKISVPAAQAALKAYPKEVRAQILGNPAIKQLAAEIAAARGEAEVASLDDFVPVAEVAEATPAAA